MIIEMYVQHLSHFFLASLFNNNLAMFSFLQLERNESNLENGENVTKIVTSFDYMSSTTVSKSK